VPKAAQREREYGYQDITQSGKHERAASRRDQRGTTRLEAACAGRRTERSYIVAIRGAILRRSAGSFGDLRRRKGGNWLSRVNERPSSRRVNPRQVMNRNANLRPAHISSSKLPLIP